MTLAFGLTDTTEIHDLYPTYTGKIAFDIGANVGATAFIFAQNFETVIACEPGPRPYAYMEERSVGNVKPLNVAVSDHDGYVVLQERGMSGRTGFLFTGDSLPEWGDFVKEHTVEAVTLDTLADTYGMPDFVKIDTEGHELKIVEGGPHVWEAKPEFLIEIHSEDNGFLVKALLTDFGYEPRTVRHAAHPPDSYSWKNHYWLVST